MNVYEKLSVAQDDISLVSAETRNIDTMLSAIKKVLKEKKLMLFFSDEIAERGDCNYIISTATVVDLESEGKLAATGCAREDKSQATEMASSSARKTALRGLFLIDETFTEMPATSFIPADEPVQVPSNEINDLPPVVKEEIIDEPDDPPMPAVLQDSELESEPDPVAPSSESTSVEEDTGWKMPEQPMDWMESTEPAPMPEGDWSPEAMWGGFSSSEESKTPETEADKVKRDVIGVEYQPQFGRTAISTPEGTIYYNQYNMFDPWSSDPVELANQTDTDDLYEKASELAGVQIADYSGTIL